MHVSEVRPSQLWLDNCEVYVEIPVFLLCTPDICDKLPNSRIHLSIEFLCEEVARSFNPLCNVTIPKQALGNRPQVLLVVSGMPLKLEAIVTAGIAELLELCLDGNTANCIPPGFEDRGTVKFCMPE